MTATSAVATDSNTTTTSTTDDASTTANSDPKLDALRSKLQELDLDIYLVPSDDPHLSEYVPDAYKRRAFLSGFQGSAGTAVVSQSSAWLWTDSRCGLTLFYFSA